MRSRRPHTLSEYVRAARVRKLLVLTTALVFAAAAYLALKRQPQLYEAATVIAIETKSNEAADASRRLAAAQSQLTAQWAVRVSEQGANGLRISYRASDPETAAAAVNALANNFVAEHTKSAVPPSSAEAEALRQRALELSARLREMEEKSPWLLGLKDAAPVAAASVPRSAAPSADALRAQQLTIESLKDRQYLIQQQLADIEPRIVTVRQMVEQQKKGSNLRDNPTYAALVSRRTELEGQRDTLINRQELTEKHPRVAAIIDQIAAINRQIDELRQQDAQQANQSPEGRELRSLESERNRLKLELEITNRELARRSTVATTVAQTPAPAPTRDAAASPAAQAYFGLKRSYDETLARLDSAESKSTATAATTAETWRVSEAATAPQRPVGPSRWLLVAGAFATGLALGAIFAVIVGARRFATVQDARDVDFDTRLPLLAAIPKTVTDGERKRRARRAPLRLAFGVVVAVTATVALAAVFVATKIFSLI
ncbi:MAG TPA: hypothetical protein VKA60_04835 [Blastocatellia bacterium]|nr:hypothetical protein [Blastocatellia bacterium]